MLFNYVISTAATLSVEW